MGAAVDRPLPLPLLRVADLPRAQRRSGELRDSALAWSNLTIVSLNWMHSDREELATCTHAPSAAQARVLLSIFSDANNVLSAAPRWPTEVEIRDCLRCTSNYVPGGGAAVPLGDRGGVPTSAADVSVADLLAESKTEVAKQARDPSSLLLRPCARPKRLANSFSRLHSSHPSLVQRNCKAGLQRLVRGRHVWKHNGKRLVGGASGIRKKDSEDRIISDLPVNQLVDPTKVLRPRFGYPPRLRSMLARPGTFLVVRKRHLRHYFHHLRLGRRWHKYLAHPPIMVDGVRESPLHQAAPMGFTGSAGIAQAVTDEATTRVALPTAQRVTFDTVAPSSWPVWASIIDDLWSVEERTHPSQRDAEVSAWMAGAGRAFGSFNLPMNEGKSIDDGLGVEFQGACIHPQHHWLGTSIERRVMSTACTFSVLSRWEVASRTVERLNGKLGYDSSFRTSTRSVMQNIYPWLEGHRGNCEGFRAVFGVSWPFRPFWHLLSKLTWMLLFARSWNVWMLLQVGTVVLGRTSHLNLCRIYVGTRMARERVRL